MQNNLIGESSAILSLLDEVSRLAPINRPLLIIGERGTGKELIAERVHFLSQRWEQPFIKINCAAFTEQLLESELFGHEVGAFTGANKQHKGHFERANHGTLFLDELATLPMSAQEKLLRLIEYGEFQRVGGHTTLQSDVRIVAATNGNIVQMAENNTFRADLLDRLTFDVLNLPPLREREGDIALLAEHFAVKMTQELERNFFAGFSQQAMNELNDHHWPGNIRELRNVIERSIARCENWQDAIDMIRVDPFDRIDFSTSNTQKNNSKQEKIKPEVTEATKQKDNIIENKSIDYPINFEETIEQYTQDLLQKALHDHHYHQKNTATALMLNYDRMRYLVRKYPVKTKN